MTTGTERVGAMLRGEVLDRIPVFCNLIDQGARELGMSIREYYSRGEHIAEAQLRLQRKYGHDNVWCLFYVGKEAELLGCRKIAWAADGPPNVQEPVIRELRDIGRLQVPESVYDAEAFAEIRKCLELLRGEVGGRQPICAYVTATMTLPALLMGMERWMELLFCGPATARDELLGKCHEFFVKESLAFRRAGADVLLYSNPFGSTDTVPARYFEEHSLPSIERDIRAVGTDGVVYYCGMARMNSVIEPVLERTGIGIFYLSPLDDLGEARRIVAGRAATAGVINDIRLLDWSEAEVRSEVRRILDAGMPGGKFLFGTGVMPLSIPERNIRAMLDEAIGVGSVRTG